jgi:hypothetical protein
MNRRIREPYVRWCGRRALPPAYPIRRPVFNLRYPLKIRNRPSRRVRYWFFPMLAFVAISVHSNQSRWLDHAVDEALRVLLACCDVA